LFQFFNKYTDSSKKIFLSFFSNLHQQIKIVEVELAKIIKLVKAFFVLHQGRLISVNFFRQQVLADVAAGDLGRVRTLTQTGADIYQEGKVIFQAVGARKDSPEIVTWLLSNNQRNEEYIEMIQPDGKTLVSFILAEAERTNNANSAKAVKAHINFVVVRESEAGNLPRVQALIKLGRDVIDLKYKRADGLTALMTAVMRKRIEVVNVLLSNGADTTQVNAQNKTARDLCSNDVRLTAMLDKVGMVKELREKIRKNGASLNPQDIGGYLDKGVQVCQF
jgi:hypothetical protein